MIKVSIIIAAYNVSKYIGKCIESCINQTYKEIEVLIVNDGSTDDTPKIINKYSNNKIVKIINKVNGGLVDARRAGFEEAIGEYFLFVDGDDWLDKECIEKLYIKAKLEELDILCFGGRQIYQNDNREVLRYYKGIGEYLKLDKYQFLKELLIEKNIGTSIWSKFIKREYFIKNKIKFLNEIKYGEDLAMNVELAINDPKAGILKENLYNYYRNAESVTLNISDKKLYMIVATLRVKELLVENKLFDKFKEEYEISAYRHNFENLFNIIYGNTEYSKQLFENWKCLDINIMKNKYYKNDFKDANRLGKYVCKVRMNNLAVGKILNKVIYKNYESK